MFRRSFVSKDRVGKAAKPKRSYREKAKSSSQKAESPPLGSTLTSPIITITVGPEQRLFAAHEDVLSLSPVFAAACKGQFLEAHSKRIDLPEEDAEVFSSVLEYLYKGDYYPRLLHNKRRNSWELEDAHTGQKKGGGRGGVESTIYHSGAYGGGCVLKDTVVYCAADRYQLDELKRLALRKQGLQTGVEVATILRSARYAYDHTPEHDEKLRAHYLALIIRCRRTFKRSGTMQMEMEIGGRLFFDLFVSMCNHLDDVIDATNGRSPKSI